MRQLGMFAKFWTPGEVKTRLADAIGREQAAEFHRTCVMTLLDRLNNLADRRVLAFSPAEQQAGFQAIAGSWTLEAQVTGELGDRMRQHVAAAFDAGAQRVVLVGSDSPTLPLAFIEEAFERLAKVPAVVGPTDDGGYYLIGLSRREPPIFDHMPWSTGEVWRQTVERLTAAAWPHHQLPPWYDVDTADDLARLRVELAGPLADDRSFDRLRRVL
jgi:uncharacterized protein